MPPPHRQTRVPASQMEGGGQVGCQILDLVSDAVNARFRGFGRMGAWYPLEFPARQIPPAARVRSAIRDLRALLHGHQRQRQLR